MFNKEQPYDTIKKIHNQIFTRMETENFNTQAIKIEQYQEFIKMFMSRMEFFVSDAPFLEIHNRLYQTETCFSESIEKLLDIIKTKRSRGDDAFVISDFLMCQIVTPETYKTQFHYAIKGVWIKDSICNETLRNYKIHERKRKIKNILIDD